MSSLPDGIIVLDNNNCIIDLNLTAAGIIDGPPARLIGNPLPEIFPESAPFLEEADNAGAHFEGPLVLEGHGTKRIFNCTQTPLAGAGGESNGRIITLQDITEREEQKETLHNYAHRLELLNNLSRAALQHHEPVEIAEATLTHLAHLFTFSRASFVLFDHESQEFVILAATDEVTTGLKTMHSYPLDNYPDLSHLRQGDIYQHPITDPNTVINKHLSQTHIQLIVNVPLYAEGNLVGAINLAKAKNELFNEEETAVLAEIASALASVLLQAQRLQKERSQHELAQTLQDVNQALNSSLELNQVLDIILEQLAHVVPYDSASIMLKENTKLNNVAYRTIYQHTMQWPALEINQFPHIQAIFETHLAQRITDTRTDPRWQSPATASSVRSWLGIPLNLKNDTIGLINITKAEPHFYKQEDIDAASLFAAQAVNAISNAHLFASERQARKTAETLKAANIALTQSFILDTVLHTLLKHLLKLVKYDSATVLLLDESRTIAKVYISKGYTQFNYELQPEGSQFNISETPNIKQVIETCKGLIISDVSAFSGWVPRSYAQHIKSWLGVPLIARGQVIGLFSLDKCEASFFTPAHLHICESLAAQAAIAIQNSRLFQERALVLETLEQRVEERTHELAHANKKLTELDKLKSKFIADISHELRTPLTNLRLYLDLLTNGPAEKQKQYLSTVKEQAVRLTSLVEEILSLARFDASNNASFTQLDLNLMIEKLIKNYEPAVHQQNNSIELVLEETVPSIFGSRQQLERMITNLLINAINHTKNGKITIRTFSKLPWVYFTMQDNGTGISKEDLPHIFERFYRGQHTGQSTLPGTGLGLTIVKEIVSLHQGIIEVESAVNQGTVFTVCLPVK